MQIRIMRERLHGLIVQPLLPARILLVIACQLLRELLVDVSGTEENEVVLNCFRQVPAERYGERKPTVYERTYESEYGKENGNAGGTD